MSRVGERDLVLPTLMLLAQSLSGLTTSELIPKLQELLHPSGEDLEILSGRNDTKFSQVVSNLTSHQTLTGRGWAERETPAGSPFRLTDAGRELYERHKDSLLALTGFSLDDTSSELRDLAEDKPIVVLDDTVITEGQPVEQSGVRGARSRQLRQEAVRHYTRRGLLPCTTCEFEFSRAYGALGRGYIEIHHLRPVSFLSGEPMRFSDALRRTSGPYARTVTGWPTGSGRLYRLTIWQQDCVSRTHTREE